MHDGEILAKKFLRHDTRNKFYLFSTHLSRTTPARESLSLTDLHKNLKCERKRKATSTPQEQIVFVSQSLEIFHMG